MSDRDGSVMTLTTIDVEFNVVVEVRPGDATVTAWGAPFVDEHRNVCGMFGVPRDAPFFMWPRLGRG